MEQSVCAIPTIGTDIWNQYYVDDVIAFDRANFLAVSQQSEADDLAMYRPFMNATARPDQTIKR